MSTNSASNTQLKAFLQGEKDLKLPFDLVSSNRSGTTKYVCTKVLRILPKKRLVLLAHNGEQQVVIKLFSSASNGQREYEKEITGYDSIVSANVNSPELLEKIPDLDGCFSVIYKYLDEAESFNLDNLTTSNDRITKLLQAVATLHNHGIFQKDIHLDNLLLKNEEIYFIDLGSIKSSQSNQSLKKEKSLKNLALLFAQFFPLQQTKLVNALSTYYQARNWTLNNTSNDQSLDKNDHEKFAIFLSTAWNKRKRNYLSKCFRTCSMTQYKKTFSYEIAFRSNFLDKVDTNFISNIDQYIDKGTIIKAGNSATVAQTTINNKPILIKRYNIKNFTHLLKRFWRPSRAAISWKNANLLEFIGIPTPRPFGFIEKRIGWFRTTAYFITEYIESDELLGVYQQRKPTNYELDQINNIFLSLQHELISHGDFKAQNFLLDETGRINLIDLDAMKEHTSPHKFQMDFIKDKKRFLRNWDDTATKEIFESLLF